MKTKLMSKFSPITNFFNKQKLVSSLILCLIVFMIYFAISGFNIISGNDDYCIFKLIYFGDIGIGCVGFFFTWFISVIQPLFGNLNSYMIFQELICLSSLLAVNYVFFSKLRGKTALLLAVVFDIVYFSFVPLNIMFTSTAAVGCSAGMALLIYASMFESRKRFRIIQEICAILLVFAGSQVRFPPFEAMSAILFVFAFAVLLTSFIKNKKGNSAKKALKNTVKKYLKTGVLVIIAVIIAFGADFASAGLKHTVKTFEEINEYNVALSNAVDYKIDSYFYEKEFYQSIGIKSMNDLHVLKHWFDDDKFFTVDKLRAIVDHTKTKNNSGLADKGIIPRILSQISKTFSERIKDGSIILIAALFIFVCVIVIMSLFASKSRSAVIKFGAAVLLWSLFFIVSEGFNMNNILFIPIALLTLYISIKYDNFLYFIALALALAAIAIHLYMLTIRMMLHVNMAISLPAFVFMVFAVPRQGKCAADKTLSAVIAVRVISVLLVISSIVMGSVIFLDQVDVPYSSENDKLRQYMFDNPDKVFLINQTCLVKDYYNPFVITEEPENMANYGLWVGESAYMKNTLKRNGIKDIYKDSIDSNVVIPLYEFEDNNGTVIIEHVYQLQDYYTTHYAAKGTKITLKKIDKVGGYSLYMPVSEKVSSKKQ